ncbi:MAG: adenosylcobinamide-GDP ribazoletransferase [Caldilineaceae bacterium]|nr:adenosylcobinamide-GDP ribazoletransferase [Caldilineaceae bacterium]
MSSKMRSWLHALAFAFGFLTVLPVPQVSYAPGILGRASHWFPVVGLVLGLLVTGAHWGLVQIFPPLVAAGLTVTLWAALTGGLHLDGLADCCDGLLAATSRERRLEIMRDPRTGAFAAGGLALFLLVKVAAVAALPAFTPALLIGPIGARALLLWVAQQPTARPGGLGADLAAGLSARSWLKALLLPLLTLFLWPTLHTALAALLAIAITWWLIRIAHRRLGGVTGDVYGLVVEMVELAILLAHTVLTF